ncbi:MAG: MotA/TolQ/ExbB proton channel family protein [Gemmatimonadota bacterium]|nr:MotA/TolQ/ExbB proton channel family protein [Gemmatimonadota bacterium]
MILSQIGDALPSTPWELVYTSGPLIKVVLLVLLVFSIATWFLIVLKWWQFRVVANHGSQLFGELERTSRLDDAYRVVMRLPESPYRRVLKEGVNFFSELRPGALQAVEGHDEHGTLTSTQLETLRMIFAKEVAAERDSMARFIPWLATIGSVSPLLGLMGTVLGVMTTFLGIASGGSGNIAAVAPGVAEALITTVFGLAVAIPAVIAYNIFVDRLGLFAGELEGFAYEIVGTLAREGRV